MAQQSKRDTRGQAATRITCFAPRAREIFVAGEFNNWNPSALAMTKDSEAEWSIELTLSPGRYEYKFVVDGAWCCEPHLLHDGHPNDERAPNPFGSMNRVLLVR